MYPQGRLTFIRRKDIETTTTPIKDKIKPKNENVEKNIPNGNTIQINSSSCQINTYD